MRWISSRVQQRHRGDGACVTRGMASALAQRYFI